jgi:protein TonB
MQRTRETGRLNGSARAYPAPQASLAIAGGAAVAYDDPMSKVLGLDAKTSGVGAWFGFTSSSTVLLAGFMAAASAVAWMHSMQPVSKAEIDEIDVVREEAPPPPPPPVQAEAKPEPVAPPPRAMPHEAPPPPAPAQAAKVLTQEPDPNEPVDLTGNTIVTGNAETYAGGFTAKNGASTTAVRAVPTATGTPGGTGPVQARPAGPDRSRAPSLSGSHEWNAPFPREADTLQIDEAFVVLQIEVRADGTAAAVRIIKDPGNGFGREAQRYALAQRYAPALDHDGNPIAGTIGPIRVHFSR